MSSALTDKILTIKDAARSLGVSVDTIRRWEREGKFTATRTTGSQRRFSQLDIEYLEQFKNGILESHTSPLAYHYREKPKILPYKKLFFALLPAIFLALLSFIGYDSYVSGTSLGFGQSYRRIVSHLPRQLTDIPSSLFFNIYNNKGSEVPALTQAEVLAASDIFQNLTFAVNVPAIFRKNATFTGGLNITQDLNVGGAATIGTDLTVANDLTATGTMNGAILNVSVASTAVSVNLTGYSSTVGLGHAVHLTVRRY